MNGHHACEADYGRCQPSYPADGMAADDRDGPPKSDDQLLVDWLWDQHDLYRLEFARHWVEHNRPHDDTCPSCKASMGGYQKCRACEGSGAKRGRRLWCVHKAFRDLRDRGVSTYRSRIGERVA
jgi:hypothetical protein